MPLPILPEELALVREGYSVDYKPALRRSKFENGYQRQTPTASLIISERQVEYIACDSECYEKFRKFVKDELNFGAGWFLWDSVERGNAGKQNLLRARIKNGEYRASPENNDFTAWRITFTIEHMEID